MTKQKIRFNLAMRVLHWSMALLVFAMIFAGLTMVYSLEPWQLTLLGLHKSFGVLALMLLLLRCVIRIKSSTPNLPSGMPAIQVKLAKLSHWLLYLLMLVIPTSGLLMQYYAARQIVMFDFFIIPAAMVPRIEYFAVLREGHGLAVLLLVTVLAVHIGAALYHHFIRKDGVLKSMW
ncbi:cytochrome b [Pseudoalteromonas piscicida]|uniref:Cytochrome b n=1 Tax=Pseudoalteromonas piscicida TaxID=43662 RepID=A0AAD0W3W5_PSEO7|nr:cytochrome b [Pseudoalteromonas piscicida]ASD67793.1 cytochrome B [Pseudoalteromonas piscicida]AXR01503.1 cytochrome b [Pseudoalteromonas piscicida]